LSRTTPGTLNSPNAPCAPPSGFDFLASLKADPRLRRIPVVVMTSSETEADVVRSYELQASGFVTKPFDPTEFARTVLGVEHYWHSIVRLPASS
jgi:chemotaxis family two-component system response regulator Rcp1